MADQNSNQTTNQPNTAQSSTSGSINVSSTPPIPSTPVKTAASAEPAISMAPPRQATPVTPPRPAAPPPPSKPPAYVQKSPFRFLIPILGIGILILLLVFAYQRFFQNRNSNSGQPTKVTTITYWGLWEPSTVMKEVLAKFEAQNPDIKVEYVQQSVKDYRERLQTSLKNGQGPDLFRYHMTWTPLLVSNLTTIPENVMSPAEFENQQYPVAQKWLKTSKGYVGIPLMYEGLGLLYNQEVFEAAGKVPPKTWEELQRLAIDLTIPGKQGEIQRAGVALGTTSNVDNWSDILAVLLLQNSADLAKPNNKDAQGALTYYSRFSKPLNDADKVWDESLPSSTVAFATEKVAMIIVPSWRALEVKDMNPNLKFAIAPIPQVPKSNVSWSSIWVEGVSSQSNKDEQEAAWRLLSYLNQKDTLRDWYAAASKQRLFGEIFARVDMADQLKTDPYVGAYLNQAPNADSWYLSSRTFDNGPNDKIIKYYEDAINSLNKGDTADEVTVTLEEGINQVTSQFRLPPMNK